MISEITFLFLLSGLQTLALYPRVAIPFVLAAEVKALAWPAISDF
jgi:hypothetical protein